MTTANIKICHVNSNKCQVNCLTNCSRFSMHSLRTTILCYNNNYQIPIWSKFIKLSVYTIPNLRKFVTIRRHKQKNNVCLKLASCRLKFEVWVYC